MKRLVLVCLAACSTPEPPRLPSAAIAPQLQSRTPAAACGTDIALDDSGAIAVRYRYTYDDVGRLARARGTWADHRSDDVVEYTWDNLDHLMHLVQKGSSQVEIVAHYDTLGDLLEYTRTTTAPNYRDVERYVYSSFTEAGQPTREVVTAQNTDTAYALEYDAANRIARVTPDGGGEPTVYTYDDAARTLAIQSGTYRGLIVYDEHNHELSEAWDGPDAIASEQQMTWDGDRLLTATMRSGSNDAPHELRTVEIDTYRYDCGAR